MATTVRIENTYDNGDTIVTRLTVATPAATADIDEWFEEVIFPHTGTDRWGGDAWYDAIVVASDRADLVGQTHDWGY